MQLQDRIIFFVIVALLLGAGVVAVVRSTSPTSPGDTPSPAPSGTVSALPSQSGAVLPSSSYFPDNISKRIPECSLTGTIEFTGQVFRHRDAFFRYDKVDDPHDIIVWKVTPEGEEISIGPNRFSTLTLPKGQETLTIGFSSPPQEKEYRLFASIQYPYFVNLPDGKAGGQVEVLTKECYGSIRLIVL